MRGIQPSHQIIRIVQLLLGHGCLTWFDYSHEKHKQKIEETMLQYLTSPRSSMCIIHYSTGTVIFIGMKRISQLYQPQSKKWWTS